MTRIIILIRIPASGKSTLAMKIVSRYSQYQLISTNVICAKLFSDRAIQELWLKALQQLQQQSHQAVSKTSLAIYNATNTECRGLK